MTGKWILSVLVVSSAYGCGEGTGLGAGATVDGPNREAGPNAPTDAPSGSDAPLAYIIGDTCYAPAIAPDASSPCGQQRGFISKLCLGGFQAIDCDCSDADGVVLSGCTASSFCFTLPSTQTCIYSSGPSTCLAAEGPDTDLSIGFSAGPCPSSGLYGCCVDTAPLDGGAHCPLVSGADGGDGGHIPTAICYYSAGAGEKAQAACEAANHEASPCQWQTTAPVPW
jgi:hypothetical protein